MGTLSRKAVLLAGGCLATASIPALAQERAVDEENVIVVTAQNRAQDVQDVPIAIDVIGAEELADAGFTSANDLGAIAPAVQVNQDQGRVKINVRGIGTSSNDELQDTSVVANIDGEYINRGNVLGSALFDLERVEVLRGPQGTLYGRNSTGGAINFVTRKFGGDFAVDGSVSYGNYNDIQLNAGIDIPLGATSGVRVAGFFNDRDGYVKHPAGYGFGPFPVFDGGRSDDNHAYGGRVSFLIDDLDDNLTVNLAGEWTRREFTPQAFGFADLNAAGNGPTGPGCNADGFEQVAPAYAETLCVPSGTDFLEDYDRGEYPAPGFGLGRIGADTWALRGRLAYEFGPEATLTYTGGYREYEGDDDGFLTLPVTYRSYGFVNDTDTQSHELRLNGDLGGIVYQVGAFYFKEDIAVETGFLIPVGPNGSFLSYFGRDVSSDSSSLFGQVEVPIADVLTAVVGLRYTDNSREAVYLNRPFGFNSGPERQDFEGVEPLLLGSNEDKITWLAGLNYEPNPDTLLYAKVSTGFKGGGFELDRHLRSGDQYRV